MSADWFRDLINNKKLTFSALAAIVFMGVSLPQTYHAVENVSNKTFSYLPGSLSINTIDENCPTPTGKFLHTGVFFVILYLLMKWLNKSNLSDGLIAKYSFYSTLIFFLISSSDTYAITSNAIDGLVDASGCPTKKGVLIHGLVFLVILALVMYFPKDE